MVMESNDKTTGQERTKKSTINSKKTSKKKHSASNSVKEYDKLTPVPNSPIKEIEAEITSIKKKSFAGDKE